jgi:tRNA(Ile2) C34 agmatinyltransferase TiaS
MTILVNKAKCKLCGDIIESKYRWDFKYCKCGAIAVDGGHDYLRRIGDPKNCIELSEYEE